MEESRQDDDASSYPGEQPAADELPPLPESLIPRWLAAVVLLLLIASGGATAWMVLTR